MQRTSQRPSLAMENFKELKVIAADGSLAEQRVALETIMEKVWAVLARMGITGRVRRDNRINRKIGPPVRGDYMRGTIASVVVTLAGAFVAQWAQAQLPAPHGKCFGVHVEQSEVMIYTGETPHRYQICGEPANIAGKIAVRVDGQDVVWFVHGRSTVGVCYDVEGRRVTLAPQSASGGDLRACSVD